MIVGAQLLQLAFATWSKVQIGRYAAETLVAVKMAAAAAAAAEAVTVAVAVMVVVAATAITAADKQRSASKRSDRVLLAQR